MSLFLQRIRNAIATVKMGAIQITQAFRLLGLSGRNPQISQLIFKGKALESFQWLASTPWPALFILATAGKSLWERDYLNALMSLGIAMFVWLFSLGFFACGKHAQPSSTPTADQQKWAAQQPNSVRQRFARLRQPLTERDWNAIQEFANSTRAMDALRAERRAKFLKQALPPAVEDLHKPRF